MFFAFAQTIFVNETFDAPTPPLNSTTPPTGWSNIAISGVLSWGFGFPSAPASSASFDIDGNNMAFFDDEALGPLGTNNTAELKTPIFNNQFANITLLSFDYFFREVPITLDSFNV